MRIFTLVTYSRPFDLKAVSEHGELFLIATAIGGAAIGEMIGPRTHRWVLRKLICAGATLFLVLTSAIWFGIIASGFGTINSDVVAYGSLALLIFTVLSSGACVALSEV